MIDAVEKILGIPRKAKLGSTERVDSKKVEDEISKQENIEGKTVDEKTELLSTAPLSKFAKVLRPITFQKADR